MLSRPLAQVVAIGLLLLDLSSVTVATQIMHRPDTFKNTPNKFPKAQSVHPTRIQKRSTGKVQAAYFTNWYNNLFCPLRNSNYFIEGEYTVQTFVSVTRSCPAEKRFY